jgi:polysaccharide pyruvyl transferase WcaK-like protein
MPCTFGEVMQAHGSRPMKVLLIGEIASPNLGDQAIFATLRHLLQSHGFVVTGLDLSRYLEVGPSDPWPEGDGIANKRPGSSGLKQCLLRIVDILPNSVQKWIVFLTKKRAWLTRHHGWQEYLKSFDLVIFGGGALLMDNNWSFPLALRNLSRSTRAAGRRYVCIGCSTGRRFSASGQRWLKEFLDGCEYIALRDVHSVEGLRQIGSYEADVYVDSALLMAALMPEIAAAERNVLGLNIMSPVRHHRVTGKVYERYLDELAKFIELAGASKAGNWNRIVLFTTGDMRDYEAARKLFNWSRVQSAGAKLELAARPRTLEELCKTLACFSLVISSRMHAGILAKSFGIPLVAIGWDEKVRGFCNTIGIADSFVDIEEFRAEHLARKLSRIVAAGLVQSDDVRARLLELSELPERLRQAVNMIEGQ